MSMKRLSVLLLFWCTWHCKTTTAQGDEECKDKFDYCNLIKSFCSSPEYMEYAHANCPVTCKVCPNDVDPDGLCVINNGDCDHRCRVEDKTIKKCTCYPGFKLMDDGKSCEDVDECQLKPCPAQTHCRNLSGGFECIVISCDSNANEEKYAGRAECCQREPENTECGVPEYGHGKMTQIIRESPYAYLGQWPWQVLINIVEESILCGGTLLSRDWVVTAAHCFRYFKESFTVDLYFGAVNLKKFRRRKHVQRRAMKKHVVYPGWKKEQFEINDIALIQLDKPVNYSQQVRPVCLPNGERPKVGTPCFETGWGVADEESDTPSTNLQYVKLPLVDREKCEDNYRNETITVNKEFMTCVDYEGGKDTCVGDSGGPLVCQRCDSCGWFLAGVKTSGSGCRRKDLYGVYTDVPYYEDWIANQTSIPVTKDRSCTVPSLGSWGNWSDCLTSCGGGKRYRLRECLNGKLGQDGCPDDQATDSERCNMQKCPFFSSWSAWGDCSVSCGGGTQESTRSCQNGEAGMAGCVGATKQSQDCATNKCKGKFGNWKDWSSCSASCGEGTQTRNRLCVGGTSCSGKSKKTKNCEVKKCPVLAHLPCEDDPRYAARYCLPQDLQNCRDPRYQETIYKPYCAKSCGFC